MLPLLQPGDVAIWQSTKSAKLNTIVAVVNAKCQGTAAQLKHDGTKFVLRKLNQQYPDVESDSWEIVGYLVGIERINGGLRTTFHDADGIRPASID